MAATGHHRDMIATYHPPGVSDEVACKSSHTSWPSDNSGRNKVWNFTCSVFMPVGDADTHPGMFSSFESHLVRQPIHVHGQSWRYSDYCACLRELNTCTGVRSATVRHTFRCGSVV